MHQRVVYETMEILELEVRGSHVNPELEGGLKKDWQSSVVLHCH